MVKGSEYRGGLALPDFKLYHCVRCLTWIIKQIKSPDSRMSVLESVILGQVFTGIYEIKDAKEDKDMKGHIITQSL